MKRLAVLALSAGLFGPAHPLRAADPLPLPLPTGVAAPTAPQVPAPVLVDGLPVPADGSIIAGTRLRDRLGAGPVRLVECASEKCGPKLPGLGLGLFGKKAGDGYEPYDPMPGGKMRWCSDCAPAVKHPLPPLPAGISGDARVVNTATPGGNCADGNCADGNCGHAHGSCWARFKNWLCFKQTPLHFPCAPTLRYAPLYTYAPCAEGYGCANGVGAPACGPGVAAGGAKHGLGLPGRGGAGCTPCPTPGAPVMPGYRLANPEAPAAAGQPVPGVIETSSLKVPLKR